MRRLVALVLLLTACGGGREPIDANGLVVFIGDSITSAWPLADYINGAANAGVSGNESTQMLARFQQDVLARQPMAVVIHGGINDIRNRESTDISALLSMVQMAQAAGVRVIVGNVMPAENLGANAALKKELIGAMNADLSNAAAAFGFELVDYHSATATSRDDANRRLFLDGLHPNPRGYAVMWDELLPALESQGIVAAERSL